jgi:ribosomal protein S18 acetylase RimI-like enzyme
MIEIFKLSFLSTGLSTALERDDIIDQVKNIFYLSSSLKEFSSEERKKAFFKKWCGDYLILFPDQFFIMRDGPKVLGYLSGCLDSTAASSVVEVPGFSIFSDLFDRYPAHFHINFHPDCRGRGLGSLLVESFCKNLVEKNISGVHLVTSEGAPNVSFYKKLHFNDEFLRLHNQMNLLFMGKILE